MQGGQLHTGTRLVHLPFGSHSTDVLLVQCFVVATWASMAPAEPFLFRNYEYSHEAAQPADHQPSNDEASLYQCKGSSKHLVWEAVRASSAAPYYLADFTCGPDT